MSERIGSKLVTRPLFFDALSGEFVPRSDPDRRHRTLGRLAYAAYEQGIEPAVQDDYLGFSVIRYEPEWAPQVSVQVVCDDRFDRPTLSSLVLTDTQGRILDIADSVPAQPHYHADTIQSVTVSNNQNQVVIPIPLGEADTARGVIGGLAQHFFDRATGLTVPY